MLPKSNPEAAARLLVEAQKAVNTRWQQYQELARMEYKTELGT
jgi:hypothetical protein